MWTAGSWLLHHDKAPAHAAWSIRQFLAKHSIPTLSHPPPPIHLTYFYSLNSINLKRRRFKTVEDIITSVTMDLKAISQTSFEQLFPK
jgi:hypothetical protein